MDRRLQGYFYPSLRQKIYRKASNELIKRVQTDKKVRKIFNEQCNELAELCFKEFNEHGRIISTDKLGEAVFVHNIPYFKKLLKETTLTVLGCSV